MLAFQQRAFHLCELFFPNHRVVDGTLQPLSSPCMARGHLGFFWPAWVRVWVRVTCRKSRFDFATMNGGGGLYRIDNLLVASAPAKVTFNGACNFLVAWGIILVKQCLC